MIEFPVPNVAAVRTIPMWRTGLPAGNACVALAALTLMLGRVGAHSGHGPIGPAPIHAVNTLAHVTATSRLAAGPGCLRLSLVGAVGVVADGWQTGQSIGAAGNFAIITGLGGPAQIVDVSKITAPEVVGTANVPEWLGGFVGVAGRYGYVVTGGPLMQISLDQPANPRLRDVTVPGLDLQVTMADLLDEQHLVAWGSAQDRTTGQGSRGLLVLDLRAPDAIRLAASLPLAGATNLAIQGHSAYVVAEGKLIVVDLRDPGQPLVRGKAALPGWAASSARDVAQLVAGEQVVALQVGWRDDALPTRQASGLAFVDVSVPDEPRLVYELVLGARLRPLTFLDDYLLLSLYGRLWAIDTTVTDHPVTVAVDLPRGGMNITAGQIHHGRLLVTGELNGLRAYDVRREVACATALVEPPRTVLRPSVTRLHLPVVLRNEPRQPSPVMAVRPLGQVAGEIGPSAVGGSVGYLAVGAGLTVLDMSDPSVPRILAQGLPLMGVPEGMGVAGQALYALAPSGLLQVFDVTDPAHPLEIRRLPVVVGRATLAVGGTQLFVTAGSHVAEFDISEPLAPRRVQDLFAPASVATKAVAGGQRPAESSARTWRPGPATGTAGRLYGPRQLRAGWPERIDTVRPTAWLKPPGYVERVLARDDVAYVWIERPEIGQFVDREWRILDAADPAAIRDIGPLLPVGRRGTSLAHLVGSTLYVQAYDDAFQPVLDVLDTTDPRRPRWIGSLPMPTGGATRDLASDDEHLYVWLTLPNGGPDRLHVLSRNDAEPGRELGQLTFGANAPRLTSLTAVSGYVYTTSADGLSVIDASDASRLRPVGSIALPFAAMVRADGRRLYVLADTRRFRLPGVLRQLVVLDVLEPSRPRITARTVAGAEPGTDYVAGSLAIAAGLAVTAVEPFGVDVVDVSNPDAPIRLADWPLTGDDIHVAIAGNRLYAASRSSGLVVYELPGAEPRPAATTVHRPRGGEAAGDRADGRALLGP